MKTRYSHPSVAARLAFALAAIVITATAFAAVALGMSGESPSVLLATTGHSVTMSA